MICGKCGANLPDGSQFCTVCGNSLEAPSASAPPVQTQYYAPAARSGGFSIFGVILLIIGAALAVSWLASFVYNIVTFGAPSDIWSVINSYLTNIGIGAGIMGIGAALNKLGK
ncbi:MAG: zinc-ribbon domain-containing protein [Christensenellales bacterium]|jgi:hypothetical protein|nr:zinc ribbon domain-containing protein [Clostridiales bacterium]